LKKLGLLLVLVPLGIRLQAAQLPVNLGSAGTFTALAGSTVTNTGPSVVNGNVGVSPGSAITGFPPGSVVGGAIHAADGAAALAQADLTTAYIDAAGRTAVPSAVGNVAGDLGGLTLTPGLYNSTSALGITGILTLNAGGNPNAVWIFQIASGLTTASGSQIVLTGGAQASNIFWQVGSSASLGTTSIFNGSILAQASVTVATGAALNGRALARSGAVTLDFNLATNPGPPVTGPPAPPLAVACPLNSAQVGVAYTSLLAGSGGTPPYTYSTTGSLPPGLLLNISTGAVTGTPTTSGTTSFTANVQDSTPATANSSCTITVTAATQADVSIVKTGPATVGTLSNITYTLAVSNAGPSPSTSVTVTDVLPAGTTFVSATSSVGTCSGTTTVICSLGTMAVSASATITVVAQSPSSPGSIANTAIVSSATVDPNAGNNSSTANVAVGSASVPTLSNWGLGALALLLGCFAARFSRRARA